jgi:hypothetical protein
LTRHELDQLHERHQLLQRGKQLSQWERDSIELRQSIPFLKALDDSLCTALAAPDGSLRYPLEKSFELPTNHLCNYSRAVLNAQAEVFAESLRLPEVPLDQEVQFENNGGQCSSRLTLKPDGTFEAVMGDGHTSDHPYCPEWDSSRVDTGTYVCQGKLITFTITKSHFTASGDCTAADCDLEPPGPFTCHIDFSSRYIYYGFYPAVVIYQYPWNKTEGFFRLSIESQMGAGGTPDTTITDDNKKFAKALQDSAKLAKLFVSSPNEEIQFKPVTYPEKVPCHGVSWTQDRIFERVEGHRLAGPRKSLTTK